MNLTNEPTAWDADFSYGYLERLYERLRRDFDLHLLGDMPIDRTSPARSAFIRHDVDVSLDRARRLAEREVDWGVRTTYHVMIDSPLYDVRSDASISAIRAISEMGHEVGLHYDVVARRTKDVDAATREADIDDACGAIEDIAGGRVRSVSFHRPIPELMGGALRVAGRVSGYAEPLFRWYLSDSRARWREGDPIESLGTPRSDVLQILIHPIWWGEENVRPGERLREFLLGFSPNVDHRCYEQLRATLADHIAYRAADLPVTYR